MLSPQNPEAADDGWFGQAVALDGETAVVGAPRAYDTGRADAVTASDGWTGPLGLAGANPHEDTEFGTAVASSGTTVLVGAPVLRAGSGAYLFDC